MGLRLAMVTLGVADVGRSALFYEALGLRRGAASEEAVVFFDMDGVILALYGREALAEDAEVAAVGSGFAGITLAWNVPAAGDVAPAIAAAVTAGGHEVKPAGPVFWGGTSGYFADPDGHLWEVSHNPFFPIDARGVSRLPEAAE